MMGSIDSEILKFADTLFSLYKSRNEMFSGMDDVYYGRWDLPEGMPDWVQKVVMMDGHDAVQTSVRVISQYKNLRVKVRPMLPGDANQRRANDLETALKWNLLTSMRRTDNNILHDIAFSSVQYASTCVETVYLPYQIKVLETLGRDTKRLKALQRDGDFMFLNHHPANIYPMYSMYGLEGILIVKLQLAKEFKKEWGSMADNVVMKDDEDKEVWVTSYDYRTYDRRVVWGVLNNTKAYKTNKSMDEHAGEGIVIMDMENELGFLPFAIRRWGNSMSSDTSEKYNPMLKTMWESGQYDMLNVFASMDATLAWKRAAQPIGEHQSATGEKMRIDATEPLMVIESGPGEKFTPLPPQTVDQRLAGQYANYRGMVWQSTIARSLQSLDFPGGTAYSSINQVLSAATSSLSPYKTIMEQTIGDIFSTMLQWVRFYGDMFGKVNLYGEYGGQKAGRVALIASDTIEPSKVRIEVVVTPDIPLDMQAQINSAVLMKREFSHISEKSMLEEIGIENPDEEFDIRVQEDLSRAMVDLKIAGMQKDQDVQMQGQIMQMQAAIAQQQQAQQQEADRAAMEAEAAAAGNAGGGAASPITENTGGLGGNPAAGGTPPVQAAPGQAI